MLESLEKYCSDFFFNEMILGEEKMKTREDKRNGQTWMFSKLSFLEKY
jgi:hypothetical protein